MGYTEYGPGDSETWGAPTGHPHDPRTPDDDGDDESDTTEIVLLFVAALVVLVVWGSLDVWMMP